jgi:hypothetical protein
MHTPYRVAAVVVAGLVLSTQASAQSRIKGTARFGVDFGGEKVMQFQYSDGSTPEVTAGKGLTAAVGGALEMFSIGARSLDAQVTAGVKYSTIPPATNQSASWLRFPVEGLLMFGGSTGIRMGAGVVTHFHNVMETTGAASNTKLTFKAQPGFIAQTEWMRRQWSLDLRYTAMKYTVESGGSGEVSANSFGAGMSFWFGPGAPRK